MAAALIVALVPVISAGIAAHAGAWWVTAAVSTLLWGRVWDGEIVVYAGMIGFLGLGYAMAAALPSILLTLVVSGVVAALVARAARSFPRAVAAGASCPLLAVACYGVGQRHMVLWNAQAGMLMALTAIAAILVATLTAAPSRCGPAAALTVPEWLKARLPLTDVTMRVPNIWRTAEA